jgi:hypothetical protein
MDSRTLSFITACQTAIYNHLKHAGQWWQTNQKIANRTGLPLAAVRILMKEYVERGLVEVYSHDYLRKMYRWNEQNPEGERVFRERLVAAQLEVESHTAALEAVNPREGIGPN